MYSWYYLLLSYPNVYLSAVVYIYIYPVVLHRNYSFLFSLRSASISEPTDILNRLTKPIAPSCFDFSQTKWPTQCLYCTSSIPVLYCVARPYPYRYDRRRMLNFYQMYRILFPDLFNRIHTTPPLLYGRDVCIGIFVSNYQCAGFMWLYKFKVTPPHLHWF